jgi:hypothetical protein
MYQSTQSVSLNFSGLGGTATTTGCDCREDPPEMPTVASSGESPDMYGLWKAIEDSQLRFPRAAQRGAGTFTVM